MTRVMVSILLVALVSSFLDPTFGLNAHSVAVYIGFFVAVVVMLVSFKLPGVLVHRRLHGEMGTLRVLPWTIVIAALFVLISRLANLQPGYIYGVIIGVAFAQPSSTRDEGLEATAGMIWALGVAAAAWLVLGWYRSTLPVSGEFAMTLTGTALAAIVVAGLEASAFGLMPFRFMPGHAIYRWNRLLWAAMFAVTTFAFIHILIGPTVGYLIDVSPAAWLAGLGVFAAFSAFSVLFWAFFRFRRAPALEE